MCRLLALKINKRSLLTHPSRIQAAWYRHQEPAQTGPEWSCSRPLPPRLWGGGAWGAKHDSAVRWLLPLHVTLFGGRALEGLGSRAPPAELRELSRPRPGPALAPPLHLPGGPNTDVSEGHTWSPQREEVLPSHMTRALILIWGQLIPSASNSGSVHPGTAFRCNKADGYQTDREEDRRMENYQSSATM